MPSKFLSGSPDLRSALSQWKQGTEHLRHDGRRQQNQLHQSLPIEMREIQMQRFFPIVPILAARLFAAGPALPPPDWGTASQECQMWEDDTLVEGPFLSDRMCPFGRRA
jgi:hypothetical protein